MHETDPQTKISVVIPNISSTDSTDIRVHHVLTETYLLNNVAHTLNNAHSMTFGTKDSFVFTFENNKYMIDNVKNMRIENG